MKKAFYIFTAACILISASLHAQQHTTTTPHTQSSESSTSSGPLKVGVFDISMMVQGMPGYAAVDSMVDIYNRDSLQAEYNFYMSEYHRLDSTYKGDSVGGKAKSVLTLEQQQRQQVGLNLAYWQQISQQKSDQKREQLAQPLLEKVITAYKKILDTQKFNLILKPNSIERGTTAVTNIFQLVANELKIPLVPELGGADPNDPANQGAQRSSPK